MEYLFDQSGGSFCPSEYEVDNLIDEGFDEEEVASEDADYDDDFSASLPADPESDEREEVCYIGAYKSIFLSIDSCSYRKRKVRKAPSRKWVTHQRFWTVEGSQDGTRWNN